MLRFGQAIKLVQTVRTRISKQYQKTWGLNFQIQNVKTSEVPNPYWLGNVSKDEYIRKYKENYRWVVFPEGTLGVLSFAYINQGQEMYYVRFKNPKTKRPSNFNIKLEPHDFTTNLDPVEHEAVRDFQAKFIANKSTNEDSFEKMKRVQELTKPWQVSIIS